MWGVVYFVILILWNLIPPPPHGSRFHSAVSPWIHSWLDQQGSPDQRGHLITEDRLFSKIQRSIRVYQTTKTFYRDNPMRPGHKWNYISLIKSGIIPLVWVFWCVFFFKLNSSCLFGIGQQQYLYHLYPFLVCFACCHFLNFLTSLIFKQQNI